MKHFLQRSLPYSLFVSTSSVCLVWFARGVVCTVNMSMSQALTKVTFPIALEGDVDKLEEFQRLEYCCQLLETNITLLMHCMQQYVSHSYCCQLTETSCVGSMRCEQSKVNCVHKLRADRTSVSYKTSPGSCGASQLHKLENFSVAIHLPAIGNKPLPGSGVCSQATCIQRLGCPLLTGAAENLAKWSLPVQFWHSDCSIICCRSRSTLL